ncbi:SDR family NAD(P)-dependent oxidoreductase [Paraburkholderia oxyphila]|uniref:SDR family NAD(P)-dependent oxidoreductase n=1 Tax=Paraburkholderia oxyphila TaxID=614212 RepID=UPI000488D042|nr:SDR family NAD(P)-dependent oxidoreductase [Paraburkholderia oxyphila]
MTTNNLSSGTALVTGAARGIGLEIARQLGQDGYQVVMCDLLDDVYASADQLKGEGIVAHGMRMDVGDEGSIREGVKEIGERFGGVQVLVNNAGISPKHNGFKLPLVDTPLAEWELVMRVNLTGAFLLCRELLPALKQASCGRIVNIASVCARYASPIIAGPYNASKTGLITLSRVLAMELAGTAVTVNCVAPGRIVTPLSSQADPSIDREYIARVPVRRLGLPEDIANAVRFLVSADASGITGTVIDVNGGTFCN